MRRRFLLQAVPAAALLLSTTEEVLTNGTGFRSTVDVDGFGNNFVRNEWTSTHDMIANDIVSFYGAEGETWLWTADKYYPKGTDFAVICTDDGRVELEVIDG